MNCWTHNQVIKLINKPKGVTPGAPVANQMIKRRPPEIFTMTCKPNEKRSCLLLENKPDLKLLRTNYCVSGVMSRCSAGAVWNDQKRCKYAHKSTVGDRCMYYIEAIDGHCDCVEAQRELRKSVKKRED